MLIFRNFDALPKGIHTYKEGSRGRNPFSGGIGSEGIRGARYYNKNESMKGGAGQNGKSVFDSRLSKLGEILEDKRNERSGDLAPLKKALFDCLATDPEKTLMSEELAEAYVLLRPSNYRAELVDLIEKFQKALDNRKLSASKLPYSSNVTVKIKEKGLGIACKTIEDVRAVLKEYLYAGSTVTRGDAETVMEKITSIKRPKSELIPIYLSSKHEVEVEKRLDELVEELKGGKSCVEQQFEYSAIQTRYYKTHVTLERIKDGDEEIFAVKFWAAWTEEKAEDHLINNMKKQGVKLEKLFRGLTVEFQFDPIPNLGTGKYKYGKINLRQMLSPVIPEKDNQLISDIQLIFASLMELGWFKSSRRIYKTVTEHPFEYKILVVSDRLPLFNPDPTNFIVTKSCDSNKPITLEVEISSPTMNPEKARDIVSGFEKAYSGFKSP